MLTWKCNRWHVDLLSSNKQTWLPLVEEIDAKYVNCLYAYLRLLSFNWGLATCLLGFMKYEGNNYI